MGSIIVQFATQTPKTYSARKLSTPTAVGYTFEPTVGLLAQECRLRLKRPKSDFCNRFMRSNLRTCTLEITQIYRTLYKDLREFRYL